MKVQTIAIILLSLLAVAGCNESSPPETKGAATGAEERTVEDKSGNQVGGATQAIVD